MRKVIEFVTVWGESFELSVVQHSSSVWVASGSYHGEHHSTKDRSARSAAARWREWAHSKGG